MKTKSTPVYTFRHLVIGTGVAGLTYALKVAETTPDAEIAILTKAHETESNTQYAQGGIAVALEEAKDSVQNHFRDTVLAGDGLCREDIVELVVSESPLRLRELAGYGARFDVDSRGHFDLALEGGHSRHRVIHHKDSTGKEIIRALLARVKSHPNIHVYHAHMAVDLLMDRKADGPGQCRGATVLDLATGTVKWFWSQDTLLAGGGAGQLYGRTTNPAIATGDAVAMGSRAGATIAAMEFVQFHPTVFAGEKDSAPFLISEAVRGFGATLRTNTGLPLMEGVHPLRDLAPRDVVSRTIARELEKSGASTVFLDITALDGDAFTKAFPAITKKLRANGLDPARDQIPVAPAAHYMVGGIETDREGRTSIPHLYAAGECAHTGLHGANRLASNSLSEAMVFAHRAATHAAGQPNLTSNPQITSLPDAVQKVNLGEENPEELLRLRSDLQDTMTTYAGIIRQQSGLFAALARIAEIDQSVERATERKGLGSLGLEIRNMVCVSRLILLGSLHRTENRGVFYKAPANRASDPEARDHPFQGE